MNKIWAVYVTYHIHLGSILHYRLILPILDYYFDISDEIAIKICAILIGYNLSN